MSEAQPTVSVITANYNGARHLAAAVRSVLDQSLASLELIIVDDGSTDDSLAVIETAAAGDPRVRVFVQPVNAGPAAARNRALDEARGRWIAVFDSDDLMTPDRLERMVARAEADEADIVVDNLLVFQDGASEPGKPFLSGRDFAAPRWIGLAEYIAGARLYARGPILGYLKPLFRAACLQRPALRYREDLRIGEDYDLVLRLLLRDRRLRLEPAALYRYRKHGASISHVMRGEHVEQMIAADRALDVEFLRQPKAVQRAQAARRRSLHDALVYDRVIERLKAKDIPGAAAAALPAPSVWPLLTMPITARLRRLSDRLRHPSAPAAQPAAG